MTVQGKATLALPWPGASEDHARQPLAVLSPSAHSAPRCAQHLAMFNMSPAQPLAVLSPSAHSAPRCVQHLASSAPRCAQMSSLQTLKRKLSKQGRRGRRLENWLCGSPWTQFQSLMKDACWFPQNAYHPQAARVHWMVITCALKQTPAQFGSAFLS